MYCFVNCFLFLILIIPDIVKKLKKLSDERENDCINENIELKRENEELKKQIESNNQNTKNSKCSQTTPKTSIIICVIIIVLLLGLCIYLYFFKR